MTMCRTLVCAMSFVLATTRAVEAQRIDTVFVEVHSHRVALFVSGTGPRTVVLEAGGGSWSRDWIAVAPVLAADARVIAYDRPGYGLSEPCSDPRTAHRTVDELKAALDAARIGTIDVLVGWSYGGALAHVFAGRFPGVVRSLVLVDPAVPSFYTRMAREHPDAWTREVESAYPSIFGDSSRRAWQRELSAYDASMQQTRASDPLHRTPMTVLVADRLPREPADEVTDRVWIEEVQGWARTRQNAVTTMVARSGHHIPRQHPTAVIDAVRARLR